MNAQTKDKKPETRDERVAETRVEHFKKQIIADRKAREKKAQDELDESAARKMAYDEQRKQTHADEQDERLVLFDRFAEVCIVADPDYKLEKPFAYTTYRKWLGSKGIEIPLNDRRALTSQDDFDSAVQSQLGVESIPSQYSEARAQALATIAVPGSTSERWQGIAVKGHLDLSPPEPEASASLVVHGTTGA